MHVLYLHGFASSARSSKAAFFAERFAALGMALHCPDFNEPDFATLTTTRMIGQVEAAIAALSPGPVALIGSSLGGFVAWHTAVRQTARPPGSPPPRHAISRLVLLAPAMDFGTRPMPTLGEAGMQAWRETGWTEIVHYAWNEPRQVHYALFADAARYDSMHTTLDAPALIVQGTRDSVVDPEMVVRFARGRPSVTLRLVDDDHQLHGSLDAIWRETAAFLALPDVPAGPA
jgi:uncharacterized protein